MIDTINVLVWQLPMAGTRLIFVQKNMANTKWLLDPAHSEIQFKVKHLMITTVTGSFNKMTLEVETTGDNFMTATNIHFSADTASVHTNNEQRDQHLRSADFFDSANYPQIIFVGRNFTNTGKQQLLHGDLTIRGVSKPVTVNVDMGGITTDGYGQVKAGFSINGIVNRKEFGLLWGAITEAGNVVVSDDVKFHAEIQLIKQ